MKNNFYVQGWGVEYTPAMQKEFENADQTNIKRISARRSWRSMIGDEVVVKNGRLETKWTVRDNITKEECPEINTHMNNPGVRGFNFKDMMVSTRKARDNEASNSDDDTTIWHPRISPFCQKKEQSRREKRGKKRKAPRPLSFNGNEVSIEDAFTKHLKLFQMFWPGNWRNQLQTINAKITNENDAQVSCFRSCCHFYL